MSEWAWQLFLRHSSLNPGSRCAPIAVPQKVTNYPKARREAAYKVYLRTCLDGRAAYLGDLEDLLFTRFPDFPQYQALKMLNDATLNRLYEDEPIGMEVRRKSCRLGSHASQNTCCRVGSNPGYPGATTRDMRPRR